MPKASIPVDLRNPGQVFACLGFAELMETLWGEHCHVAFAYSERETATRFTLTTEAVEAPFLEVLRFLHGASVAAVAPSTLNRANLPGDRSTAKWQLGQVLGELEIFPSPIPPKPANLPVELRNGDRRVTLSQWADTTASGRDNVKFWAGSGGYPGAAIARDMIKAISSIAPTELERVSSDPLAFESALSGSFRFDWRRDYVPIDAGFSPNKHGDVKMVGYPVTEILAVAGLQHARPARVNPRDKLQYRFSVTRDPLPLIFARAVLGGAELPVERRNFAIRLGWPGKAGQARCIIDAFEEI